MGTATLAARALLAVGFAAAALTKLPDPSAARQTLLGFGAGRRLARLGGLLAPAELIVSGTLIRNGVLLAATAGLVRGSRSIRRVWVTEVLVDGDGQAHRAYGVRVNPAAFAIAPDGVLASGQDAIEDLIRLTLHRYEPMPAPWNQTTHAA